MNLFKFNLKNNNSDHKKNIGLITILFAIQFATAQEGIINNVEKPVDWVNPVRLQTNLDFSIESFLFKFKHIQPFHLTCCKITGSRTNNKKIDNDSFKKKS